MEEELEKSSSLLKSTLESTADAILVVDLSSKIVLFNNRFIELWRIPELLANTKDDKLLLQFVLDQLINPEAFIEKVNILYQTPETISKDKLEFKDGRVFERYSQPQRIGDSIIGRVWSFRDITERENA
jgi:PAS domain-containing protein